MTTPAYGPNLTGIPKQYVNNVSNAVGVSNVTNCLLDVDTALPLIGDGGNNKIFGTIATGKCSFDPTFNSNNGGIITDLLADNTQFTVRITVVNLDAQTTAVMKSFLAFDKTIPGTGVTIKSSPLTIRQDKEQAFIQTFFGGGIEAIYPVIEPQMTRDIQINGFQAQALENQ